MVFGTGRLKSKLKDCVSLVMMWLFALYSVVIFSKRFAFVSLSWFPPIQFLDLPSQMQFLVRPVESPTVFGSGENGQC
jgi:hypothetical protein